MFGNTSERELREIAAGLSDIADRVRSLSERSVQFRMKSHSLDDILARSEELARIAEREYRLRRLREAYVATEHLGEPVWDLLLDLFAHTMRQKPISITSASLAAHCPPTSALRYIDALVQDGMILREPDPTDGRRFLLQLSEDTVVSLGSFLMAMVSPAEDA